MTPPSPLTQVENQEGVENFDAILAKTDSIMVRVLCAEGGTACD